MEDDYDASSVLGEAKYENGGFKMQLKPVTDPELLISIYEDMPKEAHISDLNVK